MKNKKIKKTLLNTLGVLLIPLIPVAYLVGGIYQVLRVIKKELV